MKKFKTKNCYLNYKLIILIIIILILFSLFSFITINNVNSKIFDVLLYNFDNNKTLSHNIFTSNLDYLINNYSFYDKKKYINNNKVYLYNDIYDLLKNNLIKLGYEIEYDITNKNIKYYIQLIKSERHNTITINNKKYTKIKFILDKNNNSYEDSKKILEKLNKYLNDYYPNVSDGIKEINNIEKTNNNEIIIEIDDNDYEVINNSTEIIALMLYYLNDEI